jgi:hypothetical protein
MATGWEIILRITKSRSLALLAKSVMSANIKPGYALQMIASTAYTTIGNTNIPGIAIFKVCPSKEFYYRTLFSYFSEKLSFPIPLQKSFGLKNGL